MLLLEMIHVVYEIFYQLMQHNFLDAVSKIKQLDHPCYYLLSLHHEVL
jgi:hypothetical protein